MEKPEHITRMQDERADLEERIAKAQAFLDGPGSQTILNRTQIHLLNIQLDAMRAYCRVLNVRIEHDTDLAEYQALEAATEGALEIDDDAKPAES